MYARHANGREQIDLFDERLLAGRGRAASLVAQVGCVQTRVELCVSELVARGTEIRQQEGESRTLFERMEKTSAQMKLQSVLASRKHTEFQF